MHSEVSSKFHETVTFLFMFFVCMVYVRHTQVKQPKVPRVALGDLGSARVQTQGTWQIPSVESESSLTICNLKAPMLVTTIRLSVMSIFPSLPFPL